MKKLIWSAAVLLAALSFSPAKAQIKIDLSLNIGTQPNWGPVGYDHAEYYYLPDIGCYYDVPHQQFVYLNGSSWVRAAALPPRFGNYDLYSGYKVVINQPTPYLHDNVYRAKYASFKGRRGQAIINDSHDQKYVKNHARPDYNAHRGPQGG